MKTNAMQLDAPGVEGVVAVTREVPTLGAGQALLRMSGSSLNYHDAVVVWGLIPGMRYPRIPLSDGCGTVLEVADGVDRVAPGDRVAPAFYPRWLNGPPTDAGKKVIFGEGVDGCCVEHMVVDADCLVRVPDHLSDVEAGTLTCAAVTAWTAVVTDGKVGKGETVVVQGTGGVSLFALGFAKALGARVILTSSSDEKIERGRSLGADDGINYREHPDWASEVMRLTDDIGADVIVDVGGESSLGQSVLAARVAGHIGIVGVLGGFGNAEVPVTAAMTRNLKLQGVTVGSRDDFDTMCRFMESHAIRPAISDTFAMRDLAAAVRHLEGGLHFGKVAIEIG